MFSGLRNLSKFVSDLDNENEKLRALNEHIEGLTNRFQEKDSKLEEQISKLTVLKEGVEGLIRHFQEENLELKEENSKLRALIEDFEGSTTRSQSSSKLETGSLERK